MDTPALLHFAASLPQAHLAAICNDVADLLLGLDDTGTITDASTAMRLPQHTVAGWVGRRAPDIAMPDSADKLRRILEEPAPPDAPQWRHVNLRGSDGSCLPMLIRVYRLPDPGRVRTVLFGRDLAPLQDASERFQRSQQSLVRHYEDYLRSVTADCRRRIDASDVALAAQQVAPVEQIVAAFARRLRWHCAQAALARHGFDRPRAAAEMDIPPRELDRILSDGPEDRVPPPAALDSRPHSP